MESIIVDNTGEQLKSNAATVVYILRNIRIIISCANTYSVLIDDIDCFAKCQRTMHFMHHCLKPLKKGLRVVW